MSDYESTDTDESYHLEEVDDSDSEDYSTLESDLYESEEETFAPLSGGWARVVDVFKDEQPHDLPILQRPYSGVNPALGVTRESSVLDCIKKFITDDVVQHVIECTNERAKLFF